MLVYHAYNARVRTTRGRQESLQPSGCETNSFVTEEGGSLRSINMCARGKTPCTSNLATERNEFIITFLNL